MTSIRVSMAFILAVVVLSMLAGVSVFTVVEADEPVVSTQEARAANSIPVKGLEAQKMGSAAWNVTGSGAPEPVKSGHAINWAPTCIIVAYYYVASRDYSNIDAASPTGIVGVPSITGFPNFSAALSAGGFGVGDITSSWTPQTLGADVNGQDWMYDSGTKVETRYYTGGQFTISLNGQRLLRGNMPDTTMIIDYNDTSVCIDDQISGSTTSVRPIDDSSGSPAAVQQAASAFVQDLGNEGIRFVFDSFQPAGQDEFVANDRKGAIFEIQVGRIETASIPVADVRLNKSVSTSTAERGDTVTYTPH